MTVYAYDEQFECAKATKGEDSIRLYDDGGNCIAAFEGISDFSGYSIEGGEWETAVEEPTTADIMAAIERGLSL